MNFVAACILAASIYIHDGDTIRCAGTTYRLVDLNTPETRAQFSTCPTAAGRKNEIKYGLEAKAILVSRLKQAETIRLVPQGGKDRHGRTLARLYLDGADWSVLAPAITYAEIYKCRKSRCPKRKGWCNEIPKES